MQQLHRQHEPGSSHKRIGERLDDTGQQRNGEQSLVPQRLSRRFEKNQTGNSLIVAMVKESPIRVLLAPKSFKCRNRKLTTKDILMPPMRTVTRKRIHSRFVTSNRTSRQNCRPMLERPIGSREDTMSVPSIRMK